MIGNEDMRMYFIFCRWFLLNWKCLAPPNVIWIGWKIVTQQLKTALIIDFRLFLLNDEHFLHNCGVYVVVALYGTHLLLSYDGSVVVQGVGQDIAAHGFAWLKVKVLKERWEIFELQNRKDVVVGIHWYLEQPGQLLGHSTTGCNAKQAKERRY